MMLQSDLQKPGRTGLLRPALIALVALCLIACVAGALAWYVAAQAAGRALDAMIAREQAHGRLWSCPERRIAGFPFAVDVSCKEPRFAGLISGKPMEAQAKSLKASVYLLHPDEATTEIEAPFTLRSQDGRTNLAASWSSLRLVASGLPLDVSRVAFNGEGLAVHGAAEGPGAIAFDAAGFDGVIGKSANGPAGALDFKLAAQQVTNPLLATVLGSSAGSDLRAQGTLTQADFDLSARPADSLERWRLRGGRIEFADLGFVQGSTQVSARGTLMLDAAHRLQGRLETEAQGIEPILRRFGINPSLVTAGMLLSNLLGGASAAAQPNAPAALRLPLRLEEGGVIVGPVQTAMRLPALY